jgi:hypothetical protein
MRSIFDYSSQIAIPFRGFTCDDHHIGFPSLAIKLGLLPEEKSMKQIFILILAAIFCANAWGQTAPAQNPAPLPPPAPVSPMHYPMHHPMMHHPMPDMKAQLDSMRTKIADLKTNLVKVKDPATRQALPADLDRWESMATHMEAMQKMMPPASPAMAMHYEEGGCPCCAEMMKQGGCGMGCCGGNKCMQSKPSAPAAPEASVPPAN